MTTTATPFADLDLGITIDDVHPEQVYCHVNGKRAPGSRVNRLFPMTNKPWGGTVTMRVFNDSITAEKFEEYFTKAGLVAGVGTSCYRAPASMGLGRFKPTRFHWTEV